MLAVTIPCLAAGIRFDEIELVPEATADRDEHPQRLVDNLRPDAIAAQDGDLVVHGGRVAGEGGTWKVEGGGWRMLRLAG